MKKVILGMILLNQLVSGMDLPTSSEQEQRSNPLVSVTNTRETTIAQLSVNELQDMIRNSVRESVSAVLGNQTVNTQEFQVALNVVSLRLRDAFSQQMNLQAVNFQNILAREEENHRREIEARDAELEEARNEKIRVEREKELLEQISRIFIANPSLKPDKIEKSEKINSLPDIFKKRAAVQAGYSKFAPFSSLLGREDFGISAKQSDLAKVSEYLNSTKISQKPSEPTWIRDAFWMHNNVGPFDFSHYVFPDEGFIRGKYGLIRVRVGFLNYEERMTVDWYNRCKDIENTERRNAYNNAMSAWNAEVAKAKSVAFPSEEFDRLVEQFNVFVSKIK